MRREYIDSMNAKGFGEFINACEELKNCKYVLAENKIAALLKSVADNKQLYSMFGAALYGFDYKSAFSECVINGGFVLPNVPQKAIALVFRILIDLDSGKMPLTNFLEAYFYSESINESYARFGLEVISPFLSYCRMLFVQADSQDNTLLSPESPISRAYDKVNDKFRADLKQNALDCLNSLIDIADTAISGPIDKAEYIACLRGLIRAIKKSDYDDIISAFLGVKYAVSYFFTGNAAVSEIYKKLEYDIKHLND